jgi:DNA recombination protein RmuC
MQEDTDLWTYAWERNILLVGPTTLLFVIRIVDNLWHQERQARNVDEVMERGAKLYEKFVGFIDDLEEVGGSLKKANEKYGEAYKKLSTGNDNLVRQVEKLRSLGVKPNKTLKPRLVQEADSEDLFLAAEAEDS